MVENPCYPGLRRILQTCGAGVASVDVDEGGLPVRRHRIVDAAADAQLAHFLEDRITIGDANGVHVIDVVCICSLDREGQAGNAGEKLVIAGGGTAAAIVGLVEILQLHAENRGLEAIHAAEARLLELVPADGSGKAIVTRVHALAAEDAWQAICQTAERLSADLICLGTHGRTGVGRWLIGSVAESVVRTSPIPVLTVRKQERKQ